MMASHLLVVSGPGVSIEFTQEAKMKPFLFVLLVKLICGF